MCIRDRRPTLLAYKQTEDSANRSFMSYPLSCYTHVTFRVQPPALTRGTHKVFYWQRSCRRCESRISALSTVRAKGLSERARALGGFSVSTPCHLQGRKQGGPNGVQARDRTSDRWGFRSRYPTPRKCRFLERGRVTVRAWGSDLQPGPNGRRRGADQR